MLTKIDKCDLSQKGLEKKKKDIAEAMSIAANKILICENYQQNQNPGAKDVEILEFLTKVHQSSSESILSSFDGIKHNNMLMKTWFRLCKTFIIIYLILYAECRTFL